MHVQASLPSFLISLALSFGLWASTNPFRYAFICQAAACAWMVVVYSIHRWTSGRLYRALLGGVSLCLSVPLFYYGDPTDDVGATTLAMTVHHFVLHGFESKSAYAGAFAGTFLATGVPASIMVQYLVVAAVAVVLAANTIDVDEPPMTGRPLGTPTDVLVLATALLALGGAGSLADADEVGGPAAAAVAAAFGIITHTVDRRFLPECIGPCVRSGLAVSAAFVLQVFGAGRGVAFACPSLWAVVDVRAPSTGTPPNKRVVVHKYVLVWTSVVLLLASVAVTVAREYDGALYIVPLLLTLTSE